MANLSAQQQNWLSVFADMLREREAIQAKMNPTMMGTLMDLILPSAEFVEKRSYGDPLFRMPPSGTGGYVPITADKKGVAEAASLIPIGSPAAKGVTKAANVTADALVREITRNPLATAPGVLRETSMPFMNAVASKIVKPGDKVSGLTVREEVPNTGSISASLDDYEILSGIREVPRKAFDKEYLDSLSFEKLDSRTKDLARQIQESKEINPMIVGVDSKGAYIIEGGHRFDALMAQDTKSIPAMVVVDKSDPPSDDVLKGLLDTQDMTSINTAKPVSQAAGLLDQIPEQQIKETANPLYNMTKEEFLGSPKIVSPKSSEDLRPRVLTTNKDAPLEPFLGGKFQTKIGPDGAVVFDGEKPIASYNFGRTLVVDPKYRKQGIAEELVYQWRSRYPSAAQADTRTKASQKIQEKVWERIQNEKFRNNLFE